MERTTHRLVVVPLIVLLLAGMAIGQAYNPFNQRDDTYPLLGLKRARQDYLAARSEFERAQQLYDKNLITQLELDQAHALFTNGEVNYQQSLLAVLFEKQYVTVSKAVKYQAADGVKHARLTLANASGGSAEFQKLVEVDNALFRSLQPDIVNNVYVSILNDENAIISQPYEAKIDQLRHGQPVELDFQLLQDVDVVTVFMVYANGNQRTMKILLQKDATQNRVIVQSEQFSQEVELGNEASFDLTLELFSGTSNTFSLVVVNLPDQIGRFFKAPSGGARLSQVKFTESGRTKRAALEVMLPDRPNDDVLMDQPIPFYVLVLSRDKAQQIDDLHTRMWTEEELVALEVGMVRLELIPRGRGELLVRLAQLYHSIDFGESASMDLELLNEGSNRIDNVEIRVDLPLNWTKSIDPQSIESVEIGRDAAMNLTVTPPENVAPGKYEIRLRSSGITSGQPISGEDKSITVEVRAGSNVVGSVLIVILLIGIVGGVVVYAVRLSRR